MESLRLDLMPADRAAPRLAMLGDMSLRLARVHEFCGPARRTLALHAAARMAGPVMWIRPGWAAERLNPEGMQPMGVEPGRVIFVDGRRGEDLLWSAEECLRAGAAPLVVCELAGKPGLTPVRRLHLAAQTGADKAAAWGGEPPLGLLLIQGQGGVPGVESRWYMTCTHSARGLGWRLERRRARDAPPMVWDVDPEGRTRPRGHPAERT
jgi:protein ImuA